MKSRVRDGTGRLKERGDGERRGTGRLKERGKRGKHGSPEGEGGGERHAPAKPRLVAVLRSKLRFTRFLQVPTGSHCLSPPPPLLRAIGLPTFPFSLLSPSTDRLTLSFSVPPLLQAIGLPTFPFSLLSPSTDGFTLSFSAPPLLRAIGLPHSPKLLLNLNYIERKKHYFEAIYLIFISYYCILILFSLLYYQY